MTNYIFGDFADPIEIVETKEIKENGMKYLNINISNSEVERDPDIVRLCSDAGTLEYTKSKTGKWIPVTEKLPEESGRYLAYIVNKHDNNLQYIMTCDYSADGYWNWFPDDECASDNVVAWMPLPKPYEVQV